MSYNAMSLEEKVRYLVNHKGEMSVELWNDRAQCVLAPLAADLAAARAEAADLRNDLEIVRGCMELWQERHAAISRMRAVQGFRP